MYIAIFSIHPLKEQLGADRTRFIKRIAREAGLSPVEYRLSQASCVEWGTVAAVLLVEASPDSPQNLADFQLSQADQIQKVRLFFPQGSIGVLIGEGTLSKGSGSSNLEIEARVLNAQLLPIDDDGGFENFIERCRSEAILIAGGEAPELAHRELMVPVPESRQRRFVSQTSNINEPVAVTEPITSKLVIGICHFLGGVGASSLVVGLGSALAENGRSVVLVDLDEVGCCLSRWFKAPESARRAVGQGLAVGDISPQELNQMAFPVTLDENSAFLVPQPLLYSDSLHYKANFIPGAPSSATFISCLVRLMLERFDTVIFDLGRTWGIGAFAALPHCDRLLMATGGRKSLIEGTFDSLSRLAQESKSELRLSVWRPVITSVLESDIALLQAQAQEQTQKQPLERSSPISANPDPSVIPYSNSVSGWER